MQSINHLQTGCNSQGWIQTVTRCSRKRGSQNYKISKCLIFFGTYSLPRSNINLKCRLVLESLAMVLFNLVMLFLFVWLFFVWLVWFFGCLFACFGFGGFVCFCLGFHLFVCLFVFICFRLGFLVFLFVFMIANS